jgi:hypothetical protein
VSRNLVQIAAGSHGVLWRLALMARGLPILRLVPWRYRIIGIADAADELPTTLPVRTAMLVGMADRVSWLAFDCPRHRGERILLNLSFARRPRWVVETSDLLSLSPSVDTLHCGSRCHFWIKRGAVRWVK